MNGVLPLWKPKGMTSHDCVMKVRRLYQTRKVGHTGTLDPDVEGVLGICIGEATKIVPFLTEMDKTYIAECSLGIATETEDASGEIIDSKDVLSLPTKNEIEAVLMNFRGLITQIPPMYSAVKVKGKKLYEYARNNEYVQRPKREVKIHELTHLTETFNEDETRFMLKINCSKGTYIRTLCVDIGKQLGYPAHMSNLMRTEACSITRKETVTFQMIEEAKEEHKEDKLLIPMLETLQHMERIKVNETYKWKVENGQKLKKPASILHHQPFLVIFEEQLLAIYEVHPKDSTLVKPIRVFN